VVKSQDNATTATTSVSNSTNDSNALGGNAVGLGYGVLGTSTLGAGVLAWSVTPPDPLWFDPSIAGHTGVFGSSPAGDHIDTFGTGVWGDSEDTGVLGTGGIGVNGYGGVGVEGDANSQAGSIGVVAYAPTTAQYALKTYGKVYFDRAGRTAMASGKSSLSKTLAGVTSTSKVFAVLATSESGRYVRAVVPASGKFTVYLNTTLTSSAVVSWFVID
jgi:hypothetical protein